MDKLRQTPNMRTRPLKNATTKGLRQHFSPNVVTTLSSSPVNQASISLLHEKFHVALLPSSNCAVDRQELRHQIGLSESAEKGSGAARIGIWRGQGTTPKVAAAYKLLREACPLLVALENDWKGKNFGP